MNLEEEKKRKKEGDSGIWFSGGGEAQALLSCTRQPKGQETLRCDDDLNSSKRRDVKCTNLKAI